MKVFWSTLHLIIVYYLFWFYIFFIEMEDYERCLIGTLYVSKFYKSWLIFYKLGLCNTTDVRNKLKCEYFCPWNSADGENWNYLSMYDNCQAGVFSSIEESEIKGVIFYV